jgi:hypothetical protein
MAVPLRRAPSVERTAPRAPLNRAEHRQLRLQQPQHPAVAQRRAITGAQPSHNGAQQRFQVLQQQRQSGRLTRAEQRENRALRRIERAQQKQPAVKPDLQQSAAPKVQQNADRLKELQHQRRLNRAERRELRELRRLEGHRLRDEREAQQQAIRNANQRLQRLQQQRQQGRLSRDERRELRQLRRAERQEAGPRSPARHAGVQARFASKFHDRKERREARGAARLAAKAAWRLGLRAHHVPWYGAVYWPYAYHDIFYYPFWPSAYEQGYWAFVYDDFFDGMFFPDGAPSVDYAYTGPYAPQAAGTTGAAASSGTPGRSTVRPSPDACTEQARITTWPFEQIEQEVGLDARQKDLLAELKRVSADVAERFKEACPENLPMTPPGRLQAMVMRLQATLDAVKTVRPPLQAFYEALSDEQRVRFNEVGPAIGQRRGRRADRQQRAQGACGGEMAGLSSVPLERIEEVVQPTGAQLEALDQLDAALMKAVAILSQACPATVAPTPLGQLEAMEQRLEAMVAAANVVRPALDDFYAVLSDEQKAKFNRMGPRDTARVSR